ncbi:hypothetical protein, partial [Rhizobium ruizarguesonis]|uniref:hypothetical protein n=1 Tax=Rhizobium ruizarguesonis TaxID=2081791 RepID=UPI001952E250
HIYFISGKFLHRPASNFDNHDDYFNITEMKPKTAMNAKSSAAAYVRQSPGNALLPTDRNTPNHGASWSPPLHRPSAQ